MVAGRGARLRLEEAVVEHVKGDRPEAETCERRLAARGGQGAAQAAATLGEDTCGGAHADEGLTAAARSTGGSLASAGTGNPPTLESGYARRYRGVTGGHREEGELLTTAPKPLVLGTLAILACVVPLRSVLVATTGDDVDIVAVGLLDWITVPYILAGAVAWLRRPESRLGPLMLAGGFASGLSALQLTHADSLYTVGALFDVLPAALFLHVCLAFPDGRLRSRYESSLVGAAYAAALGLQLVKISFGAFGPRSLVELSAQPDVARVVQHVQLLSLSAICLLGAGVLVTRRRQAGRPRRRLLALLIDLFALGLVMIAVLFTAGTFDWPGFLTIQRTTLAVIGIAPIVFLLGLLDARLARSAVGDLILELRADPAPADLRDALSDALRDPSLTLAYWLPDFQAYVDLAGREVELPAENGRTATLIERNGGHVA